MDLPRSTRVAARLEWLAEVGSTNTALVARASGADAALWPAGSVLVTDTQTAGRGRLGRAWTAPPGESLAISVLLRPAIPAAEWGWLPLVAGVSMTLALQDAGAPAGLKWPNDVLIGGRKVCGVLAEVLPAADGVVIGAGLNHLLSERDLPVPTATSLAIEGISIDPDVVIADYLRTIGALVADLEAAGGDAVVAGVYDLVKEHCITLGARVQALLPDGRSVRGVAGGLGRDGTLRILPLDAEPVSVSAGDVQHLRYE